MDPLFELFGFMSLVAFVEEAEREKHARRVVANLDLDERFADLIPLEPPRRKRKAHEAYDRVLEWFMVISQTDEPERSEIIEDLIQTHRR